MPTAQTSIQHQYRRGPSTDMRNFTGGEGEPVVDTTVRRLVIHDNVTVGGWPQAKASFTAVADAAYQILNTDAVVMMTSLSAARVLTLPSAGSVPPGYPTGQRLNIMDASGVCSSINTITVAAFAGTGEHIGASSIATLSSAWAHMTLIHQGSSQWARV